MAEFDPVRAIEAAMRYFESPRGKPIPTLSPRQYRIVRGCAICRENLRALWDWHPCEAHVYTVGMHVSERS
jgi:hypothetical protein